MIECRKGLTALIIFYFLAIIQCEKMSTIISKKTNGTDKIFHFRCKKESVLIQTLQKISYSNRNGKDYKKLHNTGSDHKHVEYGMHIGNFFSFSINDSAYGVKNASADQQTKLKYS